MNTINNSYMEENLFLYEDVIINTINKFNINKNNIKSILKYFPKNILNNIDFQNEKEKVLKKYVKILNKYDYIVIIAVGGSILSIKAILSLIEEHNFYFDKVNFSKIILIDNQDQIILHKTLLKIIEKDIAIITISKSNISIEVFSMVNYIMNLYSDTNNLPLWIHIGQSSNENINQYIRKDHQEISSILEQNIISENKISLDLNSTKNSVSTVKEIFSLFNSKFCTIKLFPDEFIEYDETVTGRFSVFSTPSLLIIMLLGYNTNEFYYGAQLAYNDFLTNYLKINNFIRDIAITITSLYHNLNNIYLSNNNSLYQFNIWKNILYIESLGKKEDLYISLNSLTINCFQHNYIEYFINSKNKTIIHIFISNDIDDYDNINNNSKYIVNNQFFAKNQILKIQSVSIKTIIQTLKDNSCPYILSKIPINNLQSIGYNFAESIIKVFIIGYLLNINIFEQNIIDFVKKEIFKKILY